MKSILGLLLFFSLTLSVQSHATPQTCGASEIGKVVATIDMELYLLQSGLYNQVRNKAMVYITNIVKQHLLQARVCDSQSQNLLQNTLNTIDTLVIYNQDKRDYTINTAINIFNTFKNLVSVLSNSAEGHLARMLQNKSSQTSKTCGALEIGKAIATIDMEIDLLNSGLYQEVRNESMVYITNIVKGHFLSAEVCDNQSYDLLLNTLRSIDTLVINNADQRDYTINTSQRIYATFKNLASVLENSANNHLESYLVN